MTANTNVWVGEHGEIELLGIHVVNYPDVGIVVRVTAGGIPRTALEHYGAFGVQGTYQTAEEVAHVLRQIADHLQNGTTERLFE
jgi:hypothetical protein